MIKSIKFQLRIIDKNSFYFYYVIQKKEIPVINVQNRPNFLFVFDQNKKVTPEWKHLLLFHYFTKTKKTTQKVHNEHLVPSDGIPMKILNYEFH